MTDTACNFPENQIKVYLNLIVKRQSINLFLLIQQCQCLKIKRRYKIMRSATDKIIQQNKLKIIQFYIKQGKSNLFLLHKGI